MARLIAMWSGPRNISTAMMRAWENRPDTTVMDEPLYAHYLQQTGLPHPGAAEVIAAYETDWRAVVTHLTDPDQSPNPIVYQKHMTHHLLPHMDQAWLLPLTNCFLIRSPQQVIASLAKKLPFAALEETGIPQQVALFRYVQQQTGTTPSVIDANDVLRDPKGILSALCARLGIPFYDEMLSWRAGKRASDGVWAPYWYAAVEASTGFMPYEERDHPIPPRFAPILEACQPLYDEMARYRLTA